MNFKEFILLKEEDGDINTLTPKKRTGVASDKGKSSEETNSIKSVVIGNSDLSRKITVAIKNFFSEYVQSSGRKLINKRIDTLKLDTNSGAKGITKFYIDVLYKMLFDENGNPYDMRDRQHIGTSLKQPLRHLSDFEKDTFYLVNLILRDIKVPYTLIDEYTRVLMIARKSLIETGETVESAHDIYMKKSKNAIITNFRAKFKDSKLMDNLVDDVFEYTNSDNKGDALKSTGLPIDLIADNVMGLSGKKGFEELSDEELIQKDFPTLSTDVSRAFPHKEKLMDFATKLVNTFRHSKNNINDRGRSTVINNVNDAVTKSLNNFLDTEKITDNEAKMILQILGKYGGDRGIYAGSNKKPGEDKHFIISRIANNIGNDRWEKIRPAIEKSLGVEFDVTGDEFGTSRDKRTVSDIRVDIDSLLDDIKTTDNLNTLMSKWRGKTPFRYEEEDYSKIQKAIEDRWADDKPKSTGRVTPKSFFQNLMALGQHNSTTATQESIENRYETYINETVL